MDAALTMNGCAANHNGAGSPESKLIGCALPSCPDAVGKANPIAYVTQDDPPMLLGHGDTDCTVPWQQSQLLTDALRGASVSATFRIIAGGMHAIESCPVDTEINAFLDDRTR
jgi:acetyl esterase/lipase